jgi:cation:H+ antiporter
LPASIIGATAVGLGTSLPELATIIQALNKDLFGMALGNVIGCCINNLTLILRLSALLSFPEVGVDVFAVQSIMFYVLLSSLSVWYMVGVTGRVSRELLSFYVCCTSFLSCSK